MNNNKPSVEQVEPVAAIPGGEVIIRGQALQGSNASFPQVAFGETIAPVMFSTEEKIIARVPNELAGPTIRIQTDAGETNGVPIEIGVAITDTLHPVANPAVDAEGNIYSTFSGARGQSVPVSIYRIDRNYQIEPFQRGVMNATGLALNSEGSLFVSSRSDGIVYRITPDGNRTVHAEGMGVATGIAFDTGGSLYVGDRSGSIFKVGPDGQIFVVATLEPSVAAYHLAFGPEGLIYVTGPTTTSFDAVYRINEHGEVTVFYRGLGRPQGLAFDAEGNLYVVASIHGRRGVVRITPAAKAELVIAGPNLVGLAFAPGNRLVLASSNGLYHMNWPVPGLPLLPQ